MSASKIERLQRSGILRRGPRRAFRFVYAESGKRVGKDDLERARALVLPPAWKDVAIDRSPRAALQAVGRDAAGRWQYVYHERHVRRRERAKHGRLVRFGRALPSLRKAIAHDLRRRDLGREEVLAAMMRLLGAAFIRPGSEVYAAENGSYGIATLRRRHVTVRGDTLEFDFRGKSGKQHVRSVRDARIARLVRKLLKLPGYEVFKFVEEDRVVDVRRADLTAYVKQHMGDGFTAKDFRTWTANLICACSLARSLPEERTKSALKRAERAALVATSEQLGNTPAICRSSYVSPRVLSEFEKGNVIDAVIDQLESLVRRRSLHPAEVALLRLLRD